MSGFKDMLARDIRKVFLNTDEFAQRRTVHYDGVEYLDIPLVLEGPVKELRDALADDHVQGLHKVTAVLYCALDDLGGKIPKAGDPLEVATREGGRFLQKYGIIAATDQMGMLRVELEATAE